MNKIFQIKKVCLENLRFRTDNTRANNFKKLDIKVAEIQFQTYCYETNCTASRQFQIDCYETDSAASKQFQTE